MHKKHACENEKLTLDCPNGEYILVDRAYYGRENSETCPTESETWSTIMQVTSGQYKCKTGADTLDKVKSKCNMKNSCELHANNEEFRDVCIDVPKYLEVDYKCIAERLEL